MQRRQFMFTLSSICAILTVRSYASISSDGDKVTILEFSDEGKPVGRIVFPKIKKDAEWKRRLSPLAYQVTREKGTERAFSQLGYNKFELGLYRCVCCDNALFDANTKYDSGTGWPSFWQPIAVENVRSVSDHGLGMERIGVQCALCDAHLGHVFDDGPKPSGLRYCMNAVALHFIPKRG